MVLLSLLGFELPMAVSVREISTANSAAEPNVRKKRNLSLDEVFTDTNQLCRKKQPPCLRTKSSR